MGNQTRIARTHTRAVIAALLLLPVHAALGQWTVPDELEGAVNTLDDEQAAFLTSGKVLEFLPERQLEHELRTRDADSLRAFVRDVMALAEMMAYDPEEDMGAIPLNLTAWGYNGRTVVTPAPLRDFERLPGPFSVHRYLFPMSGVPTFGGAPVAVYPEDLVGWQRGYCHRRRSQQHEQRPPRFPQRSERDARPGHDFDTRYPVVDQAVRRLVHRRLRRFRNRQHERRALD